MLGNKELNDIENTNYYQSLNNNSINKNNFSINDDDNLNSRSVDYLNHSSSHPYYQYNSSSQPENLTFGHHKNFFKTGSDSNLYSYSHSASPDDSNNYAFPNRQRQNQSPNQPIDNNYFYKIARQSSTYPPLPIHSSSPIPFHSHNSINNYHGMESQSSSRVKNGSLRTKNYIDALDENVLFDDTSFVEPLNIKIDHKKKPKNGIPGSYTSESNRIHRALPANFTEENYREQDLSGSLPDSDHRGRGLSGSSIGSNPPFLNPTDPRHLPSSYRSENSNIHHLITKNNNVNFFINSQGSEESTASSAPSEKYFEKKLKNKNLEKINGNNGSDMTNHRFSSFIKFDSVRDLSLNTINSPYLLQTTSKSQPETYQSPKDIIQSPDSYKAPESHDSCKSPDSYEVVKTDSNVIQCLNDVGYKFSSSLATINRTTPGHYHHDSTDPVSSSEITSPSELDNTKKDETASNSTDIEVTPREIINVDDSEEETPKPFTVEPTLSSTSEQQESLSSIPIVETSDVQNQSELEEIKNSKYQFKDSDSNSTHSIQKKTSVPSNPEEEENKAANTSVLELFLKPSSSSSDSENASQSESLLSVPPTTDTLEQKTSEQGTPTNTISKVNEDQINKMNDDNESISFVKNESKSNKDIVNENENNKIIAKVSEMVETNDNTINETKSKNENENVAEEIKNDKNDMKKIKSDENIQIVKNENDTNINNENTLDNKNNFEDGHIIQKESVNNESNKKIDGSHYQDQDQDPNIIKNHEKNVSENSTMNGNKPISQVPLNETPGVSSGPSLGKEIPLQDNQNKLYNQEIPPVPHGALNQFTTDAGEPSNLSFENISFISNLENSFSKDNSYLIVENSNSPVISGQGPRTSQLIKSPKMNHYTDSLLSKNSQKIIGGGLSSPKFSPLVTPNRMSVMSNDIYSHNATNSNKYLFKSNRPGSPNRRGSPNLRGSIYGPPVPSAPTSKRPLTNMEKVKVMKENHKNKEVNIRYDLIVGFSEGNHQCMLCFKSIKPTDKIWNCPDCYLATHLYCINQYALNHPNTSTSNPKPAEHSNSKNKKSAQGPTSHKNKPNKSWNCPSCRKEIDHLPKDYFCFCHKVKNPKFNEYIIPHSCGNTCGKIRPDCKHPCKDRCHPGPCTSCRELVGFKKCHCGRHTFQYLCGDTIKEARSCGEICGRLLNCGLHYCNSPCHPGPCEDCAELITESCMCGQELRFLICGQKNTYVDSTGRMFTFKNYVPSLNLSFVSCGRPCKRVRSDCGHVCGRPCHVGRCLDHPCTAPCGKIKSCGHPCDRICGHTEACDAEPCKSICGADKTCCLHTCKEICHYGKPCPEDEPCTERMMAMCECLGQTFEMMCGATKKNPNLLPYIELVCNCQPKNLDEMATEKPPLPTHPKVHPPPHLPNANAGNSPNAKPRK